MAISRRSLSTFVSPTRISTSGPAIVARPTSSISLDNPTIDFGPGGISGSVDLGGVTIRGTIPLGGGGGSEPSGGSPAVPSSLVSTEQPGGCDGILSIRDPITGNCINIMDAAPGGDPFITGAQEAPSAGGDRYGAAVKGYFGVGILPRVDVRTVKSCPPGTALGKDGVCYKGLGRNSPKRMWPMGEKPLMTGGDRAAVRRASRVASKLMGAKKALKKAGKALEKVGC